MRQEQSRRIVDRFFAWCDGLVDYALDDTPLAKAIGYARTSGTRSGAFSSFAASCFAT